MDIQDEPTLLNSPDPTVIVIQGVRLKCHKRDEKRGNSPQSLPFDALAFARDPLIHRTVLPNTSLSAVALKWTSSIPEVTQNTLVHSILGEVEELASTTEIRNRVATKRRILIS